MFIQQIANKSYCESCPAGRRYGKAIADSISMQPIIPVRLTGSLRNITPRLPATRGFRAHIRPAVSAVVPLWANRLEREAEACAYYCKNNYHNPFTAALRHMRCFKYERGGKAEKTHCSHLNYSYEQSISFFESLLVAIIAMA